MHFSYSRCPNKHRNPMLRNMKYKQNGHQNGHYNTKLAISCFLEQLGRRIWSNDYDFRIKEFNYGPCIYKLVWELRALKNPRWQQRQNDHRNTKVAISCFPEPLGIWCWCLWYVFGVKVFNYVGYKLIWGFRNLKSPRWLPWCLPIYKCSPILLSTYRTATNMILVSGDMLQG